MDRTFVPALEAPTALGGTRLWFCVRGAELLVVENGETAAVPARRRPRTSSGSSPTGATTSARSTASTAGGRHPDDAAEPAAGAAFTELRPLWTVVDERALRRSPGVPLQIVEWDRTHRFCGRCGTRHRGAPGERAKRCPACGLLAFPRVSPAVDRADHARRRDPARPRQALPDGRMYSVLAGFVDPGESLEEASRARCARRSASR